MKRIGSQINSKGFQGVFSIFFIQKMMLVEVQPTSKKYRAVFCAKQESEVFLIQIIILCKQKTFHA
ncbi:hypothetical protein B1P92_07980 [Enterococcus faecium]|nr:hypothetical protein B1P92_07980 [Enterococcus faecium]